MTTKTEPKQLTEETAPAQRADEPVTDAAPPQLEVGFIENQAFVLEPVQALARMSVPVQARSDQQKAMDAKVRAAHEAWVKAGSPTRWIDAVNARLVVTYFVEPEKAAELRKLIGKSARLLDVSIKFGSAFTVTEPLIKQYGGRIPESYLGREVVTFIAKTRGVRAVNPGEKTDAHP